MVPTKRTVYVCRSPWQHIDPVKIKQIWLEISGRKPQEAIPALVKLEKKEAENLGHKEAKVIKPHVKINEIRLIVSHVGHG